MTDLPTARTLRRRGEWTGPAADRVVLGYDARFLRRKRLVTEAGNSVLADMPETTNLEDGDALELADGRLIAVEAAEEPVLAVTGPDLARLAWHIGNRHTPCQIEAGRLVIRQDHVLAGMLVGLGAKVVETIEPFRPEGGAYGLGRTLGHAHDRGGGHDHANEHGHGHGKVHHHVSHHHGDADYDADDNGDPGAEA
jgi:urease accessory protein